MNKMQNNSFPGGPRQVVKSAHVQKEGLLGVKEKLINSVISRRLDRIEFFPPG